MAKLDFDLSGVKIPKTVAGVKVPKKLRKKGKKLLAKASSPQGRDAIAAGLALAGTLLAAKVQAKAARGAAQGTAQRTGPGAARDAATSDAAQQRATAEPHTLHGAPAGSGASARAGRQPGEPGIGPNPTLDELIASGVGIFQRFVAGTR